MMVLKLNLFCFPLRQTRWSSIEIPILSGSSRSSISQNRLIISSDNGSWRPTVAASSTKVLKLVVLCSVSCKGPFIAHPNLVLIANVLQLACDAPQAGVGTLNRRGDYDCHNIGVICHLALYSSHALRDQAQHAWSGTPLASAA